MSYKFLSTIQAISATFTGNSVYSNSTPNRTVKVDATGLYLSRTSDGAYPSSITADGSMYYDTRNSHIFRNDGTASMTLFDNTRNVGIGTSTDSGYKLDVNGKFRVQYGTVERGAIFTHSNGTTAEIVIGNGSAAGVGVVEIQRNGTSAISMRSNAVLFNTSRLVTPSTFFVTGPYGGSNIGTSVRLASNTVDQGVYTATSGTQSTVVIGNSGNEIWQPSSGNATYNLFSILPSINTSGTYAGIVRGFYYSPTLTSITGVTHRAIETVTGDVIFGSTSGNVGIGTTSPATKLDVIGDTKITGATSAGNYSLSVYNSSNAVSFYVRGFGDALLAGTLFLGTQNGPNFISNGTLGITSSQGAGNQFVRFTHNNGNNAFRILSNSVVELNPVAGNVLIGTTTDAGYKLDVNGTAIFRGNALISSAYSTPNTTSGNLRVLTTNAQAINVGGSISLGGNGANPNLNFVVLQSGSETGSGDRGYFSIYTNGTGISSSFTERLRVTSNGTLSVNHIKDNIASASPLVVYGSASQSANLTTWFNSSNSTLVYVGSNGLFGTSSSITASSAIARGVFFNNTLVAAANNDVLVGLDITPTFTNGAFTGLTNLGLRVNSGVSLFSGNVVLNGTNLYFGSNLGNVVIRPVSTTNFQIFNNNTGATLFLNANGAVQIGQSNVTNWARFSATGHTIYGTTNTNFYSNGNVGIATASDNGYKLQVNGNVNINTANTTNNLVVNADTSMFYNLTSGGGQVKSNVYTTSVATRYYVPASSTEYLIEWDPTLCQGIFVDYVLMIVGLNYIRSGTLVIANDNGGNVTITDNINSSVNGSSTAFVTFSAAGAASIKLGCDNLLSTNDAYVNIITRYIPNIY